MFETIWVLRCSRWPQVDLFWSHKCVAEQISLTFLKDCLNASNHWVWAAQEPCAYGIDTQTHTYRCEAYNVMFVQEVTGQVCSARCRVSTSKVAVAKSRAQVATAWPYSFHSARRGEQVMQGSSNYWWVNWTIRYHLFWKTYSFHDALSAACRRQLWILTFLWSSWRNTNAVGLRPHLRS